MSEHIAVGTYHVFVDAPADAVYDFVNDLRNFPSWAIHFCKGIRLLDDGAIVTSPQGDVYFGVSGDRDTGVLDWWSGPTRAEARRWPTRVVALPDGASLYQVTALFQGSVPPNVDPLFADELGMIKRLVEAKAMAPS